MILEDLSPGKTKFHIYELSGRHHYRAVCCCPNSYMAINRRKAGLVRHPSLRSNKIAGTASSIVWALRFSPFVEILGWLQQLSTSPLDHTTQSCHEAKCSVWVPRNAGHTPPSEVFLQTNFVPCLTTVLAHVRRLLYYFRVDRYPALQARWSRRSLLARP